MSKTILSTKAQSTRERLRILSHECFMMRYVLHVFGDRQDELRSNNTSSRPLISCAFSPLSLSLFSMALLHSMYVSYLSLGNRRMLSKRRIRWNVRNKFPPSSPLALFARFIVLRERSRSSLARNGQATTLPLLISSSSRPPTQPLQRTATVIDQPNF